MPYVAPSLFSFVVTDLKPEDKTPHTLEINFQCPNNNNFIEQSTSTWNFIAIEYLIGLGDPVTPYSLLGDYFKNLFNSGSYSDEITITITQLD